MAEEGEWRRKMSVGGSEGSLPGEEGDDYTTYIVRADLYYTLYNLRANLYTINYVLYNLRAKLPQSHWNVHLPLADNHSIDASTVFYEWHLGRRKVDLSRISSLTKC